MFPAYLWGADWQKYKTPVLRSMTVIGYMQSGKTTFVRYLARLLHDYATTRGYDDTQIAYVETPSLQAAKEEIPRMLDTGKIRYMLVFVDDAIKAAHSRRHNIDETMLFSDVRHWTITAGILITVYATQDFRLLDRLMRNALVYTWKTLPLEWWISTERDARSKIVAWIGDHDIVDLLEAITIAIYSNDSARSIQALQTAVVRIPVQRWGPRPIRGIRPIEPPRSIWYRIEEAGEGEKEEDTNINAGLILHALTRLLNHLGGEGYRFKWNRGRYLIAKTPLGKEISLGPLGEIEEIRQIIDTIRQNNYTPA